MLYVVLTMPTLNKAYLFIFLFIVRDELCQTLEQIKIIEPEQPLLETMKYYIQYVHTDSTQRL
jgi:hypothetical protein